MGRASPTSGHVALFGTCPPECSYALIRLDSFNHFVANKHLLLSTVAAGTILRSRGESWILFHRARDMAPQCRPAVTHRRRWCRRRLWGIRALLTFYLHTTRRRGRRRLGGRQRSQSGHAGPEARHLPPDEAFLPLQRAGPGAQALVPDLPVGGPGQFRLVQLGEGVGEGLESGDEFLVGAAALQGLGGGGGGFLDLGEEDAVLHHALLLLGGGEAVRDDGVRAVRLSGRVRGDFSPYPCHALLAR